MPTNPSRRPDLWWRCALASLVGGCAAEAPIGAAPSMSAGDTTHAWTEIRRFAIPTPESAHYGTDDGHLYYGDLDGLYRIGAGGLPIQLSTGDRIATVAVDPNGQVFMAEDFDGNLFRYNAPSGRTTWVTGLHADDDDPCGMDFAPFDYSGPVLGPGEGVVVDQGNSGLDEIWAFNPNVSHAQNANNERVVHADNGTLIQAIDVAVSPTAIWVVDRGDATTGRIFSVGAGGALTALPLSAPIADPIGIDVDPVTGLLYVVDDATETVFTVDPVTGAVSAVLAVPPLGAGRFAPIDLSPDGLRLAVTVDGAIVEYGRCGLAPSPGDDCDDNGVTDVCDVARGDALDCDQDGAPDACAVASGDAQDCDGNDIPDDCAVCPTVEVVFVADTSTSMEDEGAALCASMQAVVADLAARGVQAEVALWGLTSGGSAAFPCLTSSVVAELGVTLPGTPPPGLTDFAACPGGTEVGSEDWGRGVAMVAGRYWAPGGPGGADTLRMVIPLADEGPWCGDPNTANDTLAVQHAVAVAVENRVVVNPILGAGAASTVITHANTLAAATGGVATRTVAALDLAQILTGLVLQQCTDVQDCDSDGDLDACQDLGPGRVDCDCDGAYTGCGSQADPTCDDGDHDGVGDPCDGCTDPDDDGWGDPAGALDACAGSTADNCPGVANPGQEDDDADGLGDACDDCLDVDRDGDCAGADNCPDVANEDQQDTDTDGLGDACDDCLDVDQDGDCAGADNCPDVANPGQEDADTDGLGDACDDCLDVDQDGDCAGADNCPGVANPGQEDDDADGLGDACDDCLDVDQDGDCAGADNCLDLANPGQEDADTDGLGDACDDCLDVDRDGDCAGADNCPELANPGQEDADTDGLGDACDDCLDVDRDGDCADADNCPDVANADQADADTDGVGDACDDCEDLDGDGVGPGCLAGDTDNCPDVANADQADVDTDGVGDACDDCEDLDGDGVGPGCLAGDTDNCPDVANADQADVDTDGVGDACDDCEDLDGDGVGPGCLAGDADNCPDVANADQADVDTDGVGDACDDCEDLDGDGFGVGCADGDDCDELDPARNVECAIEPDGGCGCRTDAANGGPGWLALGLAAMLRRRRR